MPQPQAGEACNSSGFVALLRACTKKKDLLRGSRVHDDIIRRGLLDECSDALVTMYAKCGALTKARELFDMHNSRDVLTWTALIAGYAQKGQGQDALDYFESMRHTHVTPDAITYACILKACGSLRALDKGEEIHDEIADQGLLGKSVVLGTALVDMYVKCGALRKAQKVLEGLPVRNTITWNALIAGYAQQGKGREALNCYRDLRGDGLSPNVVTYMCILKACGSIKDVDRGERIHDEIAQEGLLGSNLVLGNALVDMYAKCGALEKARLVLEELPIRDVVTWNALIAGYAEHCRGEDALKCYEQLQHDGFSPDAVTFVSILKASASVGALEMGTKIHDEIAKQGLLENNIVLGTALVDMYVKCGALSKAQQVLQGLHFQSVVSWTALIGGYAQQDEASEALRCLACMRQKGLSPNAVTFICVLKACGKLRADEEGVRIHDEIVNLGLLQKDIMLGNALIDMYAKCGALAKAQQVLEELPHRDVISWSTLIAGYVQHGQNEQALDCFDQMQREGLSPDAMAFSCILKAYSSVKAACRREKVHMEIAKQGLLDSNIVVGTALVDVYVKCGALAKAQQVFEELPVRDAVAWNALITGYAEQGKVVKALECFEQMQSEGLSPNAVTYICILKACGSMGAATKGEQVYRGALEQGLLSTDLMVGSAVVDMFAKCGAFGQARQVLRELAGRDAICWSALITGYANAGEGEEALNFFEEMHREGFLPDAVTFCCLLKSCGSIGAVDKGERVHDIVSKQGLLGTDVMVGTAMVDMYAKCGALVKARQVFEELPARNVATWNALIAGYAQKSEGEQVLNCLERMQDEGLSPNVITFSCVLSACSRLGRLEDAQSFFATMRTRYGLKPEPEHYTCMVDVFGRVGHLDKAIGVIELMPYSLSGVWSALLGASRKWGDVMAGRWAFEHAIQVDKSDGTNYVIMADIYAAAGMAEDASFIEALRIENKAWLWTDTSGLGHRILNEDRKFSPTTHKKLSDDNAYSSLTKKEVLF